MTVSLANITNTIPDLSAWPHANKIKLFAWYIHSYRGRERFSPSDIRECYDELHLEKPSDVNPYLANLGKQKPKSVLRDSRGYYLAKHIRDSLDERYGRRQAAIQVDKLLLNLPSKLPNLNQRTFLDETLVCFRYGAFRAATVMCWNLAYDHLCDFIISKHLGDFNTQLPKSYPKARISSIRNKDDFAEMKESEVLQVCKSANIISGNIHKILVEKLNRRNMAAHPSSIVFMPVQAEDFITDLVNNVVLKLI